MGCYDSIKLKCPKCGMDYEWAQSKGGDPDHGVCPEHFYSRQQNQPPEPEQPMPTCDICGKGGAIAEANGYAVCSQECHAEAHNRPRAGISESKTEAKP